VRPFIVLCAALFACGPDPVEGPQPVADPLAYVDPFIGSGGFGFGFGSAFPGAAAPNGLVKVGPDTSGPYSTVNFLHYSGYWHGDDTVLAFSHMHLHGTGATDYGVLGIMPAGAFDPSKTRSEQYASKFAKEDESAGPGWYATTLARDGVRVELSATVHAAHHRYTFAPGAGGALIVDLDRHLDDGRVTDASITLDPAGNAFRGRLHGVGGMSGGWGGYDVFFEARVRRPWSKASTWSEGAQPSSAVQASGTGVGAALEFDAGAPVELQLGLSLVSPEGAAANLRDELPDWNFEAARARTQEAWRARLGSVRISGGSEAERRIFYSAIYRVFLMPSVHSDADGAYRGFDGATRRAEGFRYVSDLSLWDTYRTVHPLYALIAPDVALDAVRSLHAMARDGGFFPKWPLAGGDSGSMLGASADVVAADAYMRGVRGFDAEDVWARMRAAALDEARPPGGRGGREGSDEYRALGYVPAPRGSSVSLTTEFAHDDFALSQLGRALGHDADADALLERSHGWRRLYDPASGFVRGRLADGTLAPGEFDPTKWNDFYAEADAWQTLFAAPHDVDGLAGLFGGRDALVARVEEMFEKSVEYEGTLDKTQFVGDATVKPRPYYWHGNEPDLHAAFLLAQAGRQDLMQRRAKWIRETFYSTAADGLPGNDDGGTMSAWYVLQAIGLYPVAGSDRWIVVAPQFPRAEIALSGGVFAIDAPGLSPAKPWVRGAEIDGKALSRIELAHGELKPGGVLRFSVAAAPGAWAQP